MQKGFFAKKYICNINHIFAFILKNRNFEFEINHFYDV